MWLFCIKARWCNTFSGAAPPLASAVSFIQDNGEWAIFGRICTSLNHMHKYNESNLESEDLRDHLEPSIFLISRTRHNSPLAINTNLLQKDHVCLTALQEGIFEGISFPIEWRLNAVYYSMAPSVLRLWQKWEIVFSVQLFQHLESSIAMWFVTQT